MICRFRQSSVRPRSGINARGAAAKHERSVNSAVKIRASVVRHEIPVASLVNHEVDFSQHFANPLIAGEMVLKVEKAVVGLCAVHAAHVVFAHAPRDGVLNRFKIHLVIRQQVAFLV